MLCPLDPFPPNEFRASVSSCQAGRVDLLVVSPNCWAETSRVDIITMPSPPHSSSLER